MRDVPNRNQSLVIWELNIKPISPAAPQLKQKEGDLN